MASKFVTSFRQSYNASLTATYIERLCSSWLISPTLLFALRALISLYAFIVRFTVLGLDSNEAAERDSSYFTDLTYWGLAFYFAFSAAHTASYAFRGQAFLESWPGPLKWMHSALYATITVYPWIVTAVYWAILSDGAFNTQFSTWSNISQHALNSVFAFLEILLPRSDPHPWIQLLPIIIIAALYLGLAYLSHATEHFWVYSFLNPAKNGRGLVAGACIGILVGMIVVFIIVRYLIWLRRWVTEEKLGLDGKLSYRRSTVQRYDEEMAEMSRATMRADVGK